MLPTMIIRPLPPEMSEQNCRKHRLVYSKVKKAIKQLDALQHLSKKASEVKQLQPLPHSVSDFLSELSLSWSDYVLSLRSSVQKPTILYKRNIDALRINSYNSRILELQNSNTNAQFVLDPYSAATYISSYMMKTNLALSKLMKDACSSVRESSGNAGQVLQAIGNALLNGQEVSVQHAVYVCTGLPLQGSSRDTVLVPWSLPADRTFLVKQDWELKCLPPESTDCLALSIVDNYALRIQKMHHKLPQDIRLVSADHLKELGPVDLVVAGWPCQRSSAAGTGRGLDDSRSGLFTELVRVLGELQALHQTWRRPLGYFIEHVSAGADRRPKVQEHFAAVRGVLGPELVLDAAQLGSGAHRLWAWWINLGEVSLLRAALGAQQRPSGLFVHQVLGPGRRARMPQSPGVLPWAKVETPGKPRRALNTFVSYGGSYAVSPGGGGAYLPVSSQGGRSLMRSQRQRKGSSQWAFRGDSLQPGEFRSTPGGSFSGRQWTLTQ
jgi:hypothetical protein